jgi:hypothetical protein
VVSCNDTTFDAGDDLADIALEYATSDDTLVDDALLEYVAQLQVCVCVCVDAVPCAYTQAYTQAMHDKVRCRRHRTAARLLQQGTTARAPSRPRRAAQTGTLGGAGALGVGAREGVQERVIAC